MVRSTYTQKSGLFRYEILCVHNHGFTGQFSTPDENGNLNLVFGKPMSTALAFQSKIDISIMRDFAFLSLHSS